MRPNLAHLAMITVLGSSGLAGAAGSSRPGNDPMIPVLKHVLKQARGTQTVKGRWTGTATPTTRSSLNSVQVDEDASSHVATDRVHYRSKVAGQSPRLAALAERLLRATGVTPHQFTDAAGRTGSVVMLVEGASGAAEGTPLAFGMMDFEVTHTRATPPSRPIVRLLTVTNEQATGGQRTTIAVDRIEWDPTPVGIVPTLAPIPFGQALAELRQARPARPGPPSTPTTPAPGAPAPGPTNPPITPPSNGPSAPRT